MPAQVSLLEGEPSWLRPWKADEPLRVAVIGSRDWRDPRRVSQFVKNLAEVYPGAIVVSGGAAGVDTVAERDALAAGLRVASFVVAQEPPRVETWPKEDPRYAPGPRLWHIELHEYEVGDTYGHPSRQEALRGHGGFRTRGQALAVRTKLVVRHVHQVVAFQRGGSRGTQIGIDEAVRLGAVLGQSLHVFTPLDVT